MTTRNPPFTIEYQHQGRTYSETIWATDWNDADERINSIARTGRVTGSDVMTIPAGPIALPFAAMWARVVVWWRNINRKDVA